MATEAILGEGRDDLTAHPAAEAVTSRHPAQAAASRVWILMTIELVITAATVSAIRGDLTPRVLLVSALAPIALSCIGCNGTGWKRNFNLGSRVFRLLVASLVTLWLATGLVSFFESQRATDRMFVVSFALPLIWLLVRSALDGWLGGRPVRVLLVGRSESCEKFLAVNSRGSDRGDEILGYLDDGAGAYTGIFWGARIGNAHDLADVIRDYCVERVVVVGLPNVSMDVAKIMRICDEAGTEVDMTSPALAGASEKTRLAFHNGVPLLRVRDYAAPRWQFVVKRCFDASMAMIALLLLSPLFFALCLLMLVSQGRPLLFRQTRVGKGGDTFDVLKFRTMSMDAEEKTRTLADAVAAGENSISSAVIEIKTTSLAHVTKLGTVLRRTSLDELPQLWNVLRGDMSLVGPRPIRPFEQSSLPHWLAAQRASVRPGLTGLWQVRGRSAIGWDERTNLDHAHVRGWRLANDLETLVETIPALFRGR